MAGAEAEQRVLVLKQQGLLSNPALFTSDVVRKVQLLLSDAEETGAKVAAWDAIIELLKAHNIAWTSRVKPGFVGVHPDNRSTKGISAAEVHKHGMDILTAGFSLRKAADATAIEADAEWSNHWQQANTFNDNLVKLADGMLPKLEELKLLSIGSSHTNAFLRALSARAKTCVEKLQDGAGCLDYDGLTAKSQHLRDACMHGLTWTVLHKDCSKVWPMLIDTVQKALNTVAASGQSELEVMLSMHRMMMQSLALGQVPNWTNIMKAATFSLPQCESYIHVLADYVQKSSGDGELLREVSEYQQTRADGAPKKILGSVFLGKVGDMKFGQAVKCPHVQTALLKANLSSPPISSRTKSVSLYARTTWFR